MLHLVKVSVKVCTEWLVYWIHLSLSSGWSIIIQVFISNKLSLILTKMFHVIFDVFVNIRADNDQKDFNS